MSCGNVDLCALATTYRHTCTANTIHQYNSISCIMLYDRFLFHEATCGFQLHKMYLYKVTGKDHSEFEFTTNPLPPIHKRDPPNTTFRSPEVTSICLCKCTQKLTALCARSKCTQSTYDRKCNEYARIQVYIQAISTAFGVNSESGLQIVHTDCAYNNSYRLGLSGLEESCSWRIVE